MTASTTVSSRSRLDMPLAARAVLRALRLIDRGTLDLTLPDGSHLRFGTGAPPYAEMRLADWSVCARTLRTGDIGFAESHFDSGWSTPDLPALLRLLIDNRDRLESMVYGSWWGSIGNRLRHWANRNTRSGSRDNIHAHYDLGNGFYRRWLDPTMNYSSAWFGAVPGGTLADAQVAKMRRVIERCRLPVGGRLLEIGCGWGALAETAVRERGANVVGVTLSTEQLAWARDRLRNAGLDADLRLQDYRDITDETFDAIASIEMFEAVGREYWPAFFRQVRDRLRPGGRACIQSITIRDDLYPRYLHTPDFIQRYIFPGGLLPSRSAFRQEAVRAGLQIEDEFAFGRDYAETLRHWRHAFNEAEPSLRDLGFDARFARIWNFYLAYCEAAFDAGNTDVVQFTLHRA